MLANLEFVRPLKRDGEPDAVTATTDAGTHWPIAFEYGGLEKGTRISIAKAKEIAAELRAAVAEEELRVCRAYLAREQSRSEQLSEQAAQAQNARIEAVAELVELKRRCRTRRTG